MKKDSSMEQKTVADCIRIRIPIEDENWYLAVGKTFAQITVPYENRPDRERDRLIAETICQNITALLEIHHGERAKTEWPVTSEGDAG